MITLFWPGALSRGELRIDGEAAHHARVRRVQTGDELRLLDGRGGVASGNVLATGKNELTVDVAQLTQVAKPRALEVLAPVADRDRMLLAAEKCVELQVTAWRPVYFARSRSVTPRGEGEKFREKALARMRSALEQSGGAWLPDLHTEMEVTDAWGAVPKDAERRVLDRGGASLANGTYAGAVALAVGPEGGIEPHELEAAGREGWLTASLGEAILRFETAIIAGVAVVRAKQLQRRSV